MSAIDGLPGLDGHADLLAVLGLETDAGGLAILGIGNGDLADGHRRFATLDTTLRVQLRGLAVARGDIDATYVWEPVLGKVKANGTVLTDSGKLAEQGAATYDLWVVRRDFAENNPDFLKSFVQTTLKSISDYHQNPKAFADNAEHARKIAALTGSNTNDIPLLLTGNTYLNEFQQREVLQGEFAQNIADTANFLKSQGKVDQVKPDYHDHINVRFLQP